MSLIRAKVENIRQGILLRPAYNFSATLSNDSPIWQGDVIECLSNAPLYDTVAYEVAVMREGEHEYTKVLSINLDLPSGHGRRRTDKFLLSEADIVIEYTTRQGLVSEKFELRAAQHNENRRGIWFELEGKQYMGVLSPTGAGETLEEGGMSLSADRQMVCSREQFGNETPINANDIINLAGKDYRVDRIAENPATIVVDVVEVRDGLTSN